MKNQPQQIQQITLRPDKQVVPIKIGGFGPTGAGKSYTDALLAIGLSAELHNRAPVYVRDSEPGWQFFEEMFAIEGIELIQDAGEDFDGLLRAKDRAEKAGACVFVGDSYTHFWNDLMKGFMGRGGYVEFQDWNQIKPLWRDWVRAYMNSPMHCIALARQGWNYLEQPDEKRPGKYKLVKTDSKFNAGGGESFGYEPHLLMEFETLRQGGRNGRGGQLARRMMVVKDRLQVLDGKEYIFDNQPYQKGGYAAVWNALAPHIQKMQTIKNHILIPAGSQQGSRHEYMGESEYSQREREKTALLEEWKTTMALISSGRSDQEIRFRAWLYEAITGFRSEQRFIDSGNDNIRACGLVLMRFEERFKSEKPTTVEAVKTLVESCRQEMKPLTGKDFDHSKGIEQFLKKPPEKTLLQQQLEESLAVVNGQK